MSAGTRDVNPNRHAGRFFQVRSARMSMSGRQLMRMGKGVCRALLFFVSSQFVFVSSLYLANYLLGRYLVDEGG